MDSIIKGRADGDIKPYLLIYPCKKEIDYFVYFAYELEKNNIKPYVRVNFDWGYGLRARRIDLVGVANDKIIIYKNNSSLKFHI